MINIYLIGVIAAIIVFILVGVLAGRKVKNTNDYYVAGRRAPVILIVGSLIASFGFLIQIGIAAFANPFHRMDIREDI